MSMSWCILFTMYKNYFPSPFSLPPPPHTQVVQLEKDIRQRDFTIGQLKRQSNAPSPSVASEVRYLRDQVDSLERRGDTLQRSLDHEREENERISGELAAERQRGREVSGHVLLHSYCMHNFSNLNVNYFWFVCVCEREREKGEGVLSLGHIYHINSLSKNNSTPILPFFLA